MPDTERGFSLRKLRYALWALVVVALGAVAWLGLISPRLDNLADAGTASLGRGDYRLAATDGTEFSQASLKGKASAVFFGFTHCPDVCPTTLGDVAGWREDLGADADKLRVFFVTVDPERDSVEALRDYVSWVPGVIGVSGSPEEVAKAVKAFRIYARKVPQEGGGYSMDHSSAMLLFDDRGEYAGLIGYQEDPARAMASLRRLLDS
ncbi:protein SCO1/2 [Paracoccus aminovorans]|uniref:Protein SCO1/2 n=1 Tax=Paracoccus aminovorans TaxID=34004 RepID=A0A1I2XG87_9RHOB|nr:SCO family protein [Paracoccus aminovorans]CQR85735.1 electron transport protein SCO1/SenC [Paracoccus aminovorans]SFH12520.1 protein SCO1/2 [Paracoccus aminovorans]